MTSKKQMTLVAFGDSITAAVRQELEHRWPQMVLLALQEQFPAVEINLINAGVGGNTSREGLARMDKDVLAHRPNLVLFEFGNDQTPIPEKHVSLEEFEDNLNLIIDKVAQASQGQTIPMTFPPMIDAWHANYENPAFTENGGVDAVQETYRQITRKIAQTCNCPLIDLDLAIRKKMDQQGPEACILPDGVHLTTLGNTIAAKVVLQTLLPQIEKWLA